MAKLDKLTVSGIRSFSPHEDDVQIVEFSSPLTLFLGQNGCGKTSIIESLKFACSGDIPGGTNSGQGFINDPKLNSMTVTKAQVRLKVHDANGKALVIIKSVQVQQKANNMQFKRLDSTISRLDKNGEVVNVSGRCADVDADICQELGVSKPILDNVIFCHQEDALWPLEKGEKLKLKFDEIFDATKYHKCAEQIRKHIKDGANKVKVLNVQVQGLKDKKDLVVKKTASAQSKEEKISSFQEDINNRREKLIPIEQRLTELQNLETNLSKLQAQCEVKESQQESLKQQQAEILKNIKDEDDCSDAELERKISSFENNQDSEKTKLKALKEKDDNLNNEEKAVVVTINRAQVKIGQLQGSQKQHQTTLEEQSFLIGKCARNLNLSDQLDTNADVNHALKTLKKSLNDRESSLDGLIQDCDLEEGQLQNDIDSCRKQLNTVEQSIESKAQQIHDFQKQSRDVNTQLNELEVSDEVLQNLEIKIKRIDKDLKSLKESFDTDAESTSMETNKRNIRQHEEALEILEREYKILQQNSIAEAELEMKRHEIKKRKSDILRLKNNHYQNFKDILGDVPDMDLKIAVETCRRSNQSKINEITRKLTTKQKEATTMEVKRTNQGDKLKTLENELRSSEAQVFQLCKGKSYETLSSELFQSIEKLQRDKGQYSSAKIMYEKFIRQFESENPCCPVCQTDFQNKQNSVREIITIMKRKIDSIPNKLRKVEEELREKQEQHTKLLQLKPIHEKIEELTKTTIPYIKADVEQLTSYYTRVNKEVSDLANQQSTLQKHFEICGNVISDATLIDQYQLEIEKSTNKIVELESQLLQVPSKRSKQQTEAEIGNLREDLNNTRRNFETSRRKLDQHNTQCQKLREERSKQVEKQLQLQQNMQGKPQLERQLEELTEKEQTLNSDIAELKIQVTPLKDELKHAIDMKNATKASNKTKLDSARNDLIRDQKIFESIENQQVKVEEYVKKGGDTLLENLLDELSGYKEEQNKLLEKRQEVAQKVSAIEKQLAGLEGAFRMLIDNQSLRQKRKQQETLQVEIDKLKDQIGSHNFQTLAREKRQLESQYSTIATEIQNLNGRMSEISASLKELQAELNQPDHKQAYKNYKNKFFEFRIQKQIIDDLGAFVKGLEISIMQFHKDRMVEINETIRELWRDVYRGNDCDYIEIKTEETKSVGARRTYTYKVVQRKNDVELDMRGRCSAGQKVLACLVIRIALAQTFSQNCGILALDEPTTNLDRQNIQSLSEALARLVNSRQAEKNFQLLVITHDKEFLRTLTRVEQLTHYWEVSRNARGNSVITKEML